MAELILSPLLDVIFGNLASAAMEELRLVWGVDKELNDLRSTLSAIQAVLEDAEDRQFESNAVKDWLEKLQDVAYEADDLVDDIATDAQQSMIGRGTEGGKKMKQLVCNFASSCFSCTRVGYRREMAHRIREINEQLDKIAKQKADFGLQVTSGNKQIDTREPRQRVSSVKDESEVFGRQHDREKIIESLLSDDSGNRKKFSVTAIVGMGGQGKTTLAQLVYNDERVKTKFEVRAWVCVSEDFNVTRLTKEIIESASQGTCDLSSIDALQCRLREVLNGKRFLFVLDDMWNEKPENWETLEAPFAFGAKGSKVLVTTRNREVSDIMRPAKTYNLEGLSEEGCWKLFVSRAFADDEDINDHPLLVETGKKLVGKCQGLPLAVKAVGGLLSSTREARDWENILNSPTWHRRGEAAGILPSLRLSYQHLPVHLKRCFTFCSIYPKDHMFEEAELVRMWIAQGFIRAEDGEQIEDTGSRYFSDLVHRSFFQYSSSLDSCTMHDLFHDLAQSISGRECFYMDGFGPNGVPKKTRHLSLKLISGEDRANFETLYESKGLRTLLLRNSDWRADYKVPHEMFDGLRFTRVLELANCGVPASIGNLGHLKYLKLEDTSIKELPDSICSIYNLQTLILSQCWKLVKLPDSIGNLRHLRHLKLKGCSIMPELPESLCSIYNLQTLILSDCYKLVKLPNETSKLSNLRHLSLNHCWDLKSTPPEIGRLTCLQTLSRFIVGRERETSIAELKELTDLGGNLEVENLENVEEAGAACQANLKSKRFIDKLTLQWNSNLQDQRLQEEIVEALQPPPKLKELIFLGYMGNRFPSWMMGTGVAMLLPNLTNVRLIECRRCSMLPSLGQLPSLVDLSIIIMDEIKQIEEGHFLRLQRLSIQACPRLISLPRFPSLEELDLEALDNLEEWCGVGEANFLRLRRLRMYKCPQLISLPQCPSLEELDLEALDNLEEWCGVGEADFRSLRCLRMYKCPQLISLSWFPSLEELDLGEMDSLVEWSGVQEADFRSLRKLSVIECPKMREWPDNLSELTELSVSRCPGFDAVPLFPSLRKLRLGESSDRLWNSVSCLTCISCLCFEYLEITAVHRELLQALTQLKELEIVGCDKVETLLEEDGLQNRGLPTTLTSLKFIGCSNLQSLPRRLHALTTLQSLCIATCPDIISLPEEGLPAGLESLGISRCPRLVERCQKDVGEDWPKISHIRNLWLR